MDCLMFSFLLAFVTMPMMTRCSPSRSTSNCVADHRHHGAFGHWANRANETHRLSMLMPTLHQHAFRTIDVEDLTGSNPVLLAGSTDCPTMPDSGSDEPLMGRSLCPWYWKVNYQANRIPNVLPEAVCRCRAAVLGGKKLVSYQCQPLTMRVRVLELDETCENYLERSVEISVACVSVFQSAVRLNKLEGIQRLIHPEELNIQEIK